MRFSNYYFHYNWPLNHLNRCVVANVVSLVVEIYFDLMAVKASETAIVLSISLIHWHKVVHDLRE